MIIAPGSACGWSRRPNGLARLNRESWQASGLKVWWTGAPGAIRNIIAADPVTNISSATSFAPTIYGQGWTHTANEGPGLTRADYSDGAPVATLDQPFTLRVVLYPTNLSIGTEYFWGFGNVAAKRGHNIYYTPDGDTGWMGAFVTSPPHAWYDVCVTGTGTTRRKYLNGVLIQSESYTADTNAVDRYGSGYQFAGENWGFTGLRAMARFIEARIYDYALSDTQVWSLYDPRTRWDLYAVPTRRASVFLGAAGGGPTGLLRPAVRMRMGTGR
jgi:hypothetical protein